MLATVLAVLDENASAEELAKLTLEAVTKSDWKALGSLAVFGAVWALRKYGAVRFPVLNTRRVGAALVVGLSALGVLTMALLAGSPLTPGLLASSLVMACTATGGRKLLLSFLQTDPAEAAALEGSKAGATAEASASTDPKAAADALGKLGNP